MFIIRDNIEGAQRFPLLNFIERILTIIYGSTDETWIVIRARGYGIDVCELEDAVLSSDAFVKVSSKRIIEIAKDPHQWFYDLECRDDNLELRFGVLDSGGLFIDGPHGKALEVVSVFKDVKEI